jgi:transposase
VLLVPRAVRILLAAQPIDMRNSIDGLCAVIRNQWKENLFAGNLFVFVSKRGNRLKILTWDSGGFVLTYKRLEQGRFRLPTIHEGALGAQLDGTQLAMLLDGIDLSNVRRPKKWSPPEHVGDRQIPGDLINHERWQRSAKRISASGGKKRKTSAARTPRSRTGSGRLSSSSRHSSATSSGSARKK